MFTCTVLVVVLQVPMKIHMAAAGRVKGTDLTLKGFSKYQTKNILSGQQILNL